MSPPSVRRAPWPVLALLLVGSACRTADLAVYNLNEVHEPDGTPRRHGSVHGPLEHAMLTALDFGEFGRPAFLQDDDEGERIDDPLGVCRENLAGLLEEDLDDPVVLGLAVQEVTWLGGDCTFAVSRELCAEALVPLGRRCALTAPLTLPEDATPAGAEEVAGYLAELLRAARPTLELGFGLETNDLADACAVLSAATLDRDGARRVLTVTNLMLRRQGFDSEGLAPVRALHEELLVECLGFALAALLQDESPRVRAMAVRSWIRLNNGASAAPYHVAFADRSEEVELAAVRGLARFGAPDGNARAWMERLVPILTRIQEGPMQVSACRAMARLSGREVDLHPEYWVALWDEELGAAEASHSVEAEESPR